MMKRILGWTLGILAFFAFIYTVVLYQKSLVEIKSKEVEIYNLKQEVEKNRRWFR